MSWVETVVAVLVDCKRDGLPFHAAWPHALREHPPRLREIGGGSMLDDSLFDQRGAKLLAWFEGVCEAAYEDWPAPGGGPSLLRGLHAALEAAEPEEWMSAATPSGSGARLRRGHGAAA